MTTTACPFIRSTAAGEFILAGTADAKFFHLTIFPDRSHRELTLPDKKNPDTQSKEGNANKQY
jgi:hypothetical protein